MFPNDITSICFIITSMLFQIFLLLGFLKWWIPQTMRRSILKWSKFGWFGGRSCSETSILYIYIYNIPITHHPIYTYTYACVYIYINIYIHIIYIYLYMYINNSRGFSPSQASTSPGRSRTCRVFPRRRRQRRPWQQTSFGVAVRWSSIHGV